MDTMLTNQRSIIYLSGYIKSENLSHGPMSHTIDLSEGMRLGIPFRAQKTITIDEERFESYAYEFPENCGITLIETSADVGDLHGYYGTAIAEISALNSSQSGYRYISLEIVQVDIDGELSITRQERTSGERYESNLDEYGDDLAGPRSTVDKINRGF